MQISIKSSRAILASGNQMSGTSREDVQFMLYLCLSHLCTPVEGRQKATPATYTVAGHVAESVVNEIRSWIKRILSFLSP